MRSVAIVLLASPLLTAWNHVGHKSVAGVAYDHLSKKARARVDEMVRRHPDYKALIDGAPSEGKAKARFAFMKSAYWPDMIRNDPRFYDESRPDAAPAPVQPGFPDMKRRLNWHYINVPFSTDGTPTVPAPQPNVLTQIKVIIEAMGAPLVAPGSAPAEQDPAYLLPWLLHLGGDIHQPLHCATRFRKGQEDPGTGKPRGDLGGNAVFVVGSRNLHAYWDDALGAVDSPALVEGVIKQLKQVSKEDKPVLDPERWVQEGFQAAQAVVYSFGGAGGFQESPIALDNAYHSRAREVARKRGALAGRRLAAILNARLK